MNEQESKTDTVAAPPGGVVEKRVTKTVIRRRAQTPSPVEEAVSPPSPPEVVSPEIQIIAPEPVSPPPPPSPSAIREETSFLRYPAPVIPSVAEPVEVEIVKIPDVSPEVVAAPPEGADIATDSGYQSKYKRIKVLTASVEPELPPRPGIVRPSGSGASPDGNISSILAAPGTMGLGRKEIIEIRDFHRPKPGRKKRMLPGKKAKKTEITTPKAGKRVIRVSGVLTVGELAKRMSVKANEVIGRLLGMGTMVTLNQPIDLDTASLVASEFGYDIENVTIAPEDLLMAEQKEAEAANPEDIRPRPPVVTVMGHVDHGKTSLLDAIRKTAVAAREAGGITQHIGAYSVKTENGRTITFIDTPGHEAFTAMRARGAKATDIVVLVVAADDGVMPQTKEAINHAKSANVPIVVAINKIDKPGADPEKIKKALTEFNMVPEEWGGDTLYLSVSAKTGQGLPQLLEMLALQTDILELKANPKKRARGIVIEAQLDKRRGPAVTILVQDGTLREGDSLVAGTEYGRVRAMTDDKGTRVREAGASMPVEIMGLGGVPTAGDSVQVVSDEKRAKEVSDVRKTIAREQGMAKSSKVTLDDVYQKIEQGEVKELRIVIKADTTGSVEVLTDSLQKLATPKVAVRVIHGAVGGISESDVMLATTAGALVIGFNVRPDSSAAKVAEREKVDIRFYNIIYELTDEVTKAMAGLLAPKMVEKRLGSAEVKQIFTIPKAGTVAGCLVADGKILRSGNVRLIRDGVAVYTGKLSSLKRFKDDTREVPAGMECGMTIENFNDIKAGDMIESFTVEATVASLA